MCRNIRTLYNFDPPATDDELPQMVRNEVVRQCPDVTDNCVIDYWAIDDL